MAETRKNETVHYEVLALRGGRWLIERTAPEEALAVKLADQLLQQDIGGARGSRETVGGATGPSSSRKVYERLKPKRRRQRWPPRQKAAPPGPRPAAAPAALPPAKPRRAGLVAGGCALATGAAALAFLLPRLLHG